MPIPRGLNDELQHPCVICKVGCHGAGMGCCRLVDEVASTLDPSLLKRDSISLPTVASSNVVCLGCCEKYRPGRPKEDAGPEAAQPADGGTDVIDLASGDDEDEDDLEELMSFFGSGKSEDHVNIPTAAVEKVLAKERSRGRMTILGRLLSGLDTSGSTVSMPPETASKLINELGGKMPAFKSNAKSSSVTKQTTERSSGTRTKKRKRGGATLTTGALGSWLASVEGNTEKLVERQMAAGINAHEQVLRQKKEEQMKVMEEYVDMTTTPLVRSECAAVLHGIIVAVEVRSELNTGVVVDLTAGEHTNRAARARKECDEAMRTAIGRNSSRVKVALRGTARRVVTMNEKAATAYLCLHPKIYGTLDLTNRIVKAAAAIGVTSSAVSKWVSLNNQKCYENALIWVSMVEGMTWKDVAKQFSADWANQWSIEPEEKVPPSQLQPYKIHIAKAQTTIDGSHAPTVLSKYSSGTTASSRKSAARLDASANTIVVKAKAKQRDRKDKGKGRKFQAQEEFVVKTVRDRWNSGDPIGKLGIKLELSLRDDCKEGFQDPLRPQDSFYASYFDPNKPSADSGLINWLSRVLDRHNWSIRANSIGQTVPDNWRPLSEANAADLRTLFKEKEVEVMLNMDQTFVNFYIEETHVIAPKGTKRVGGKISAEVKKGFTLMVIVNMLTSEIDAPFLVYDGTKMKDAKYPERTLAYKYKNWRGSASGRTAHMAFQKKHWFDVDITIECLDFVLDVLYPGKKVGISMDHAPAHMAAEVIEYIERRTDEGRLVMGFIDGGLTSILQVCDLAANKQLKAIIKKLYHQWRAEYVRAERAKTPDEPLRRVKLKMNIEKMTEITEAAVKEFNRLERKDNRRSIAKTFKSAGQDPWDHCEEAFKEHLDALEKLPMYKMMEARIEARTGVVLGDASDPVEIDDEADDERERDGATVAATT